MSCEGLIVALVSLSWSITGLLISKPKVSLTVSMAFSHMPLSEVWASPRSRSLAVDKLTFSSDVCLYEIVRNIKVLGNFQIMSWAEVLDAIEV